MTRRLPARDLALVAVLAALIAVLGLPGTFNPFGLAVPITAQTLGVMLAGLLLGARLGALAVLVFLALVAAGLPLLAGGRGGLAVFATPSAGYLLGWVAGAFVAGLLAGRFAGPGAERLRLVTLLVAAVVGGVAVVYAFGIPVLAWRAHLPLGKALATSWIFLPGDLAKAVRRRRRRGRGRARVPPARAGVPDRGDPLTAGPGGGLGRALAAREAGEPALHTGARQLTVAELLALADAAAAGSATGPALATRAGTRPPPCRGWRAPSAPGGRRSSSRRARSWALSPTSPPPSPAPRARPAPITAACWPCRPRARPRRPAGCSAPSGPGTPRSSPSPSWRAPDRTTSHGRRARRVDPHAVGAVARALHGRAGTRDRPVAGGPGGPGAGRRARPRHRAARRARGARRRPRGPRRRRPAGAADRGGGGRRAPRGPARAGRRRGACGSSSTTGRPSSRSSRPTPTARGCAPFPAIEVRVREGVVEVAFAVPVPGLPLPAAASAGPWYTDDDGWAGVGDRGRLGAGGVLEIAGRGGRAVSVGGQVVLSGDVERVLGAVEGVLEVACVGVPDARLGQRAAAVVRTAGGDGEDLLRPAALRGAAAPAAGGATVALPARRRPPPHPSGQARPGPGGGAAAEQAPVRPRRGPASLT